MTHHKPALVILSNTLEKYLELIIEIHGHALCMDVKNERRKMAKLMVNAISNI
jgi:hypothetical protein